MSIDYPHGGGEEKQAQSNTIVQISVPKDATTKEYASIEADNFSLRIKARLNTIIGAKLDDNTRAPTKKEQEIKKNLDAVSQRNRSRLLREKLNKITRDKKRLSTQVIGNSLFQIAEEMKEFARLNMLPSELEISFCELIHEFQNCPLGIMFSNGGINDYKIISSDFSVHHVKKTEDSKRMGFRRTT